MKVNGKPNLLFLYFLSGEYFIKANINEYPLEESKVILFYTGRKSCYCPDLE